MFKFNNLKSKSLATIEGSLICTPSISTKTCLLFPPLIKVPKFWPSTPRLPLISIPLLVLINSETVLPWFLSISCCEILITVLPEFSRFNLNRESETTTSSSCSTFVESICSCAKPTNENPRHRNPKTFAFFILMNNYSRIV